MVPHHDNLDRMRLPRDPTQRGTELLVGARLRQVAGVDQDVSVRKGGLGIVRVRDADYRDRQ